MSNPTLYPFTAFAVVVVLLGVSDHFDLNAVEALLTYAILQIASLRGELAAR